MKLHTLCLLCALAAVPAALHAQDSTPGASAEPGIAEPGTVPGPAPSRRAVPRAEPVPLKPYAWGSFLVYPEVVLTAMYDDNVYSTATGAIQDHALILSPAIWIQSNWERHLLRFHASGDIARYLDQRSEDTDDYRVSVEGRHDVGPDANVYGGARFARDHEDRESPEQRNGIEPTRFFASRVYGGMFQQFGRFSMRIGANVLQLDFNDAPFITGSGATAIINNDDRDRLQWGAGARLGFEIVPRAVLFAQVSADRRRYRSETDDLGYARDSDGGRAVLGLRAYAPERFKLEVYGGGMRQHYEDPRLADVSAALAGGNLVVRLGEDTTASLFADRTIEETTLFVAGPPLVAASSYVNSYVQVNLEHRATPAFSVYLFGSLSRADYQGIERVDDYTSVGVGFVYRVARNLYLDVTYQDRKLDSAVPSEDFARNQVFARVAVPLSR